MLVCLFNAFISSLANGNFCRLLITFANSLDPDQARQNVGPDLDPNCLTLMVFLKDFFEKKSKKKKNLDDKKKKKKKKKKRNMQSYPTCKELRVIPFIICPISIIKYNASEPPCNSKNGLYGVHSFAWNFCHAHVVIFNINAKWLCYFSWSIEGPLKPRSIATIIFECTLFLAYDWNRFQI